MPGNAEVSLFRDIKDVEIRVVINGVTAGIFHIYRRTRAIPNQQRAVEVAHQMRAGGHLHQRGIDAGIRIEAINRPSLLTFQIRDINQRGTVRDPEFVRTAFALGMLFDFPHVTAVFVDHPHPGIDQIVRPFMAEGDGVVVERTVDGMTQPFSLHE